MRTDTHMHRAHKDLGETEVKRARGIERETGGGRSNGRERVPRDETDEQRRKRPSWSAAAAAAATTRGCTELFAA